MPSSSRLEKQLSIMRRFSSSNRWAAWTLSSLSEAMASGSTTVTTPLGVVKVIQGVYSATGPAYEFKFIVVVALTSRGHSRSSARGCARLMMTKSVMDGGLSDARACEVKSMN